MFRVFKGSRYAIIKMVSKTISTPVNRVFTPQLVFAFALFNREYGNATGYENLELEGDVQNVKQAFRDLRIPAENTTFLFDSTYDEVEDLWDRVLKEKYKEAARNRRETLFIIWYGGHAEMAGSEATQIRFNSNDPTQRCYPWERNLTMLASKAYTYTIALFDCCRVQTGPGRGVPTDSN